MMKLFFHFRSSQKSKLLLFILLIFSILPAQPIGAQLISRNDVSFNGRKNILSTSLSSENPRATLGSLLPDLKNDIVYLLGEPDFYLIVGGVGTTPVVFRKAVRQETPELTEMWGTSGFADGAFEFGDGMGSALYPLLASGLSLSIGSLGHFHRMETFGSDLFRSQMINGVLTLGMKGLINRRRPNGGSHSYPSGHTSTAFATAGVIGHHFGLYAGIPAHIAAAYVGFSRLQENRHYLSDIVAGSIIGSYTAYKVTHRKSEQSKFEILPTVGNNSIGAQLNIRL